MEHSNINGLGPLGNRAISSFPLSIGTGIAFESLFDGYLPPYDPERVIPPHVSINSFQEMWINVSTLFRNMVGSVAGNDITVARPSEYKDGLLAEIEIIKGLLANEGGGVCKPVFYYCSYKRAYTHVPHKAIMLRMDTTDKQKLYSKTLMATMQLLLNDQPEIRKLDSELLPDSHVTGLLLSHVALDLLSYNHFNKLSLLESHTGIIKNRAMWYTKFQNGKDLNMIPFIRKLLYIFGDSEIYRSMDISLRRTIIEIANKGKWTALTTEAKVMQDLDTHMRDRYLYLMILSF